MKRIYSILPWLFVALFVAELVAVYMPKREKALHLREFARLPVLMNGRVQPFDTVGRNALLQIRSTGEVPLEEVPSWKFWHHPKKLKPGEWLLEVFFKPEVADTRPIFLIHHPDILAELKIGDKGVERSGLHYYTYNELSPSLPEIEQRANEARNLDDKQRSAFQKQIVKLHYALFTYQSLKSAVRPPSWENFQKELATFEAAIPSGVAALNARQEGKDFDKEALNVFWEPAMKVMALARDPNAGQVYPLVIPPSQPEQKHEDWSTVSQALMASMQTAKVPEPVKAYAAIGDAFNKRDVAGFNSAVDGYRQWLAKDFSQEVKKGRNEFFYNDTKAFLHAMIIYMMAFLLATGSLLAVSAAPALGESLRKSAFYLVLIAGVVHTFGLVFRMYWRGARP